MLSQAEKELVWVQLQARAPLLLQYAQQYISTVDQKHDFAQMMSFRTQMFETVLPALVSESHGHCDPLIEQFRQQLRSLVASHHTPSAYIGAVHALTLVQTSICEVIYKISQQAVGSTEV